MSLRILKTIADPVLYEKSKMIESFDQSLRDLVRDMFDTMYHERGVGLAAVQIGVLKRVLIIDLVESGFVKGVFINPELIETSSEIQNGEEGCLSVPGLVALLKRPLRVKVKYQDVFGAYHTISAEKLMARALMHEMDHLDGKVFVDLLEKQDFQPIANEVSMIKQGKIVKEPQVPEYRR